MPKSYQIVRVSQFPKEPRYVSNEQLTLDDFEENAVTSYELAIPNYHVGFDRYDCYHELTVRKHGRVYGKPFTRYLEPHEFTMFLSRKIGILLISAAKEVSTGFLNMLNEAAGHDLEPLVVDYQAAQPKIQFISGAWFAQINQQFLRAAGLFGPNVDQSEQFRAAAKVGEISLLMVKHTCAKTLDERTIAITKAGGIVLYENYSTVEDEIEMVMEIYNTYMA